MKIHYLQHVAFEGLGSMEDWARARAHEISKTGFQDGDPLPAISEVDLLIVMGGPMNIYEENLFPWLTEEKKFIREAVSSGIAVMGICLGAQLLADVLGARISRNAHKEIGWFPVQKTASAEGSFLFRDFPDQLEVFHWHGDTFSLPDGAIHLAQSKACKNQAFAYGDRVLGLQFHLETTPEGASKLIENCSEEIVEAPYIQPARVMLSRERFAAVNDAMQRLLDRIQEVISGRPARA